MARPQQSQLRQLRRVPLFFALGLLINLALAWSFALWAEPRHESGLWLDAHEWETEVPADWPAPHASSVQWGVGMQSEILVGSDGTRELIAIVDSHGWPLASLRVARLGDSARGTRTIAPAPGLGGGIASPINDERLPTLPLWPGLILNTMLYAGIMFAASAGTSALRRRSRLRRGLCPTCGYDLQRDYTQGCSECGWGRPVTASSAEDGA